MNTKHTPGPWRLNTFDGRTILSNQSHPIAVLSDPFHRQVKGGTGNDGPLIAAAPDLLALALRLEPWLAGHERQEKARGEREHDSQFLVDLRAAIARATRSAS